MRPAKSEAKFTVAANYNEGRIEVVVNALNQQDEFLNFLDLSAVMVGPDLKPLPIVMRQAAPDATWAPMRPMRPAAIC